MNMNQRTINNMKPAPKHMARMLWDRFTQELDDRSPEYVLARDSYHALFRDNANFVPGTEPYRND